ncbi:MAG TPA: hypothetical protein GX509_11180 [Firmicutes bacterium]|nr:hypothetical protein [Bacillota bacterium]
MKLEAEVIVRPCSYARGLDDAKGAISHLDLEDREVIDIHFFLIARALGVRPFCNKCVQPGHYILVVPK